MTEYETITISKSKYDKLLSDQKILHALYAAGVDNWDGYGEAVFPEEEEE